MCVRACVRACVRVCVCFHIIIMYIYHALINALSAHMIHINLNMIFYTHVEHSHTKTIYIKYYKNKKNKKRTTNTYTHTHTCEGCEGGFSAPTVESAHYPLFIKVAMGTIWLSLCACLTWVVDCARRTKAAQVI